MTRTSRSLKDPPIVEAVLDIECDLPPNFRPATLEQQAQKKFFKSYPIFRKQYLQNYQFDVKQPDELPEISIKPGRVQALQFFKEDEKQLIQIRSQGFSFNRLAPYTTLDNYLPQIKKAWTSFDELVKPIQIRVLRLRYINSFSLPLGYNNQIQLEEYFKNAPISADEGRLLLSGFVNQYTAIDRSSGHQVVSVLTTQTSLDNQLPVIFDNSIIVHEEIETGDWTKIRAKILEMRELKNLIFWNTLTEKCLNLFQQH